MTSYFKYLVYLTLFVQNITAQSLSPYQIKSLTFSNDIPVKTVTGTTNNIVMEVKVSISKEMASDANFVFEEFYSAGRYKLTGAQVGNELFISAPAAYEAITINGKEFLEDISIQVQLPEGAAATTIYARNQANYGSQTATTASVTRRPGLKRLVPPKTPNTQVAMTDQSFLSQTISIVYTINGKQYKPEEEPILDIVKSTDMPMPENNKQSPAKNKALETSPANTDKKKQR